LYFNTNTDEQIPRINARPIAPRPAIAPITGGDPQTTMVVAANGRPGCFGGWELLYPPGKPGMWYAFQVKVRWRQLEHGFCSLGAEAHWLYSDPEKFDWSPISNVIDIADSGATEDGWLLCRAQFPASPGADLLSIRLIIKWSATGIIEWKEPRLTRVAPPSPRPLRLGVATWQPPVPTTMEQNRDGFLQVAKEAAACGINLLCLPEVIFTYRLPAHHPSSLPERGISIPGPFIEPFCRLAADTGMAIGFSANETDGDLVYNTGVLIDEEGRIALKYRKVHLAYPEGWRGITPGSEFPVATIKTAGARVGLNICKDSSTFESARALGRLGADIILLPIMGDNRSTITGKNFDMEIWKLIQRAKALENQVYLVIARNAGRGSGIFAPDSTVLALDEGQSPIIYADIDLSRRLCTNTGAPYKDVCWYDRREPLYTMLTGSRLPLSPWERPTAPQN